MSTLGEYPTTITRIRLSDPHSKVVLWEIHADGAAQIHGFTLSEGENPVQIDSDHGQYSVLTPSQSANFVLNRGTDYRVEVWGSGGALTKKSAVFRVGV